MPLYFERNKNIGQRADEHITLFTAARCKFGARMLTEDAEHDIGGIRPGDVGIDVNVPNKNNIWGLLSHIRSHFPGLRLLYNIKVVPLLKTRW